MCGHMVQERYDSFILGLTTQDQRRTFVILITIAVRRFESPHTAERVSKLVDEIVEEWRIPNHKIFRILTDNGSNMVAGFKADRSL